MLRCELRNFCKPTNKVSIIDGFVRRMGMKARWILFGFVVPISLYVTVLGTVFMGFCPGIECWPHTFAWTLLAPCLLLAIWSIRATAITAVLLYIAHIYIEVHIYGEGLNSFWGTDKALDECFFLVVFLLVVSVIIPKKATVDNHSK
jgi:hypothetical protein